MKPYNDHNMNYISEILNININTSIVSKRVGSILKNSVESTMTLYSPPASIFILSHFYRYIVS